MNDPDDGSNVDEATRADVIALHREIDEAASRLEEEHRARLSCSRGCADCCVDDISVFSVEADRIRREHAALLEEGAPHPEGACAFLTADKACRIYDARPYVCRTQGLPIAWVDDGPDGRTEHRDICPLNEEGPPLTELGAESCWRIGPTETKLYVLQKCKSDPFEPGARVRLRDLFAPSS